MNKQNVVLTEFKILLEKEPTVTIEDLYYHLRNMYEGMTWDRASINTYIRRGFERELLSNVYITTASHGTRVYSLMDFSRNPIGKVYSLDTSGGTIQGSFQAIAKLIYDLKLPMRYSEGSDTFEDFTKLSFPHLENIVCKDLEGLTRKEIKIYFKTPIYLEYVRQTQN